MEVQFTSDQQAKLTRMAAEQGRVADAIYESAVSLHEMPNRGRPGRKPNTREMIVM